MSKWIHLQVAALSQRCTDDKVSDFGTLQTTVGSHIEPITITRPRSGPCVAYVNEEVLIQKEQRWTGSRKRVVLTAKGKKFLNDLPN